MRQWLKNRRVEKNLTMKEVAERAGTSECFYSQIESGSRNPSVKVAKQLGEVLDVGWDKFFEEQGGETDATVAV